MKKRIIVTGGLGFIGSHFLRFSVKSFPNIDFINIDACTYAANFENIPQEIENSNNYFFRKGDICDENFLESVYKEFSPTDIIHFAAETHVDKSIENSKIFFETNVLWTLTLLEKHKIFSSGRFCYISTDEVYGDSGYSQKVFSETSPLYPSSPYSASKASAEMLVHSYARTFSMNTLIIRPTNNFWPGQFSEKFIPASILRVLRNEPIQLYGNGKHCRDWIYVEDSVRAISDIFFHGKNGDVYNISVKNIFSNEDIAKKILQLSGKNLHEIIFVEDRKGHDFCYIISSEKFRTEINFTPDFSFEDALYKTFQFYKNRLWNV